MALLLDLSTQHLLAVKIEHCGWLMTEARIVMCVVKLEYQIE